MKEQKNNGRGIFYGVIGVATLVVAIIGATFAYFTATATNATNITGNMASVSFGLDVHKVTTADDKKGGMIPMSNSMVEAAVKGTNKTDVNADTTGPQICVDDNGNAVCQIYKISVTNSGTAGMFLDGYVGLTGGSDSGTNPPDYTATSTNKTTMRWAQVFCSGTDDKLTSCTTAGSTTSRATGTDAWEAIDKKEAAVAEGTGLNKEQIKTTFSDITTKGTYQSNQYDIINTNFIRVSDKVLEAAGQEEAKESFTRKDVTTALVFNQRIDPMEGNTPKTIAANDDSNGIGGTTSYTDAQVYYIVVWLTETGKNQTAGQDGVTTGAEDGTPGLKFFKGTVTFVSAQGSEVTATFSSYAAVQSESVKSQG